MPRPVVGASGRDASLADAKADDGRTCDDDEREFGGARRDRTADLLHAMQALSQLSYGPILDDTAVGRRVETGCERNPPRNRRHL